MNTLTQPKQPSLENKKIVPLFLALKKMPKMYFVRLDSTLLIQNYTTQLCYFLSNVCLAVVNSKERL